MSIPWTQGALPRSATCTTSSAYGSAPGTYSIRNIDVSHRSPSSATRGSPAIPEASPRCASAIAPAVSPAMLACSTARR